MIDSSTVEALAPPARLDFIYAHCPDLGAVRHFYAELLGMAIGSFQDEGEQNWLAFKCGSFELMFFRDAGYQRPVGWAMQPGWGGGTLPGLSWSLAVDYARFADVIRQLQADGVKAFFDQPRWQQDSYWSYPVLDPAGNTVEVYSEPPARPFSTVWPSQAV